MTRADHPSGTDRIAEVAAALGLSADAVVVNVQGDEPMIDPALIAATAALIVAGVPMATAAHPIDRITEAFNPNCVKVVLNRAGQALYFSRATIPWHRDGFAQSHSDLPSGYVRCAISGCMRTKTHSCKPTPAWPCRHWNRSRPWSNCGCLWHGLPIAVHVADSTPVAGVDTPEDLARVQTHFDA